MLTQWEVNRNVLSDKINFIKCEPKISNDLYIMTISLFKLIIFEALMVLNLYS